MRDVTHIELPVPPSVNGMFRNLRGKGRVKTPLYNDWLMEAGWRIRQQRPRLVEGRVVVVVSCEHDGKSRSDIDNRMKALLDCLVMYHVIEDDSKIIGFATAWAPPGSRQCRVSIMKAKDADGMLLRFLLSADSAYGGWFPDGFEDEEPADGVDG